MKENNLLNEYCKYHPDFLKRFELFPEREKIFQELKKTNKKSQFLSTVSELEFGIFFNKIGFEVTYEKKYKNNKTPDWTISSDNEVSICEIYKLGRSNIDQKRTDFQNSLIESLQKIPLNFLIRITFVKEYFEIEKYNIDSIVLEIKNWLNSLSSNKNESILIQKNFLIEIQENKKKRDYVKCLGIISSIDYKPEKLIQSKYLKRPNEISKKILKYKSIIEENKSSYFIGVNIDFVSGFEPSDFVEYFRGNIVNFIDYGKTSPYDFPPEIKELGEFWTELGVFYKNHHLSGIILRYSNEFYILLNPIKTQNIYNQNSTLKKLQTLKIL
ncbi:hypothetical protein QWY81_18045 [Polaribacter undariae]|uniref:Uncharacterized protein n=1 Tax=Polaribacter sejongensis TaxID=985043 RepID=A0AAJ1R071_9FLAO|nr:hypothetical protein [Polaribacter undariae]MDN3621375.1 hypothetical protein [Polaribacter undariae]UWD31839.1 hypothetical protein NQP51_17120 [Polaribacter undariae]